MYEHIDPEGGIRTLINVEQIRYVQLWDEQDGILVVFGDDTEQNLVLRGSVATAQAVYTELKNWNAMPT